jgi:Flp pilus assembly protein TadD
MNPQPGPGAARLLLAGALSMLAVVAGTAQVEQSADFRPELAVSETLAPFLKQLEPGSDGFPLERQANELEARLRELSEALRRGGPQTTGAVNRLLAPDFRGARLAPIDAAADGQRPLEVTRATDLPRDATLDARAFGTELQRLTGELRDVTVAEFVLTSIEAEGSADPPSTLRTTVRYDIVGGGTKAYRVEHVGEWDMRWQRGASGWQVVRWTAASHLVSRARRPVFTEITDTALGRVDSFRRQLMIDLDSWMATFDSVLTRDSNGHHGISVGDADGDGLDDLYVAQPAGLPNRLYRNRGDSTFEDITSDAGVAVLDDTAQSLFADVDNDGDQDLVVATSTGLLLFVNGGKGHFALAPDAFRLAQPFQGVLTSIAMADYDRDGLLDLYVCVYSYLFGAGEDKAGTPAPYHDARNGPPSVLFHNDGNGRFIDVTAEAGLDAGNDHYHFAAAWADYDGDGWPDLLVSNDFGTKNLYRNLGRRNGTVRFEDVAASAGLLDHGAGMSATFLDYDNDGRLDIYTGNMWSAPGLRITAAPTFMRDAPADVRALYRRHVRGNSLFRNLGNGRFEDRTLDAHAEMGRWAWASDALDFDSDGWDDLYVVNGMLTRRSPGDLESFFWRQVVARSPLTRVPGTPYDDAWRAINQLLIHGSIASHQRNVFLRNDGHGGYDEIAGTIGLDLDQDGRSFAVLDIDGEGDPDLVVMAARQSPQLRVFRNNFETTSASIAVRLVGTKSNRDAVGARVTVDTDRVHKTRVLQCGSGFLSQHSKEQVIGLGASGRIATLTVNWPSGDTQVFTDVPLNARVRIIEGRGIETEALKPRSTATTVPPSASAPPSAPPTTWMYEPFPAPDVAVPDLSGDTRSVAALRGSPAIVLLWSPKVDAARAARDALARGAQALTRAGVKTMAVRVDPDQPDQVSLSYAILNRHLFMNRQDLRLPTGLLVDASGDIVKVYRGRVDLDDIVVDASAINAAPAERLARALPFPGTFYYGLPLRNYLPYGSELLDNGLEPAAVIAFERAARANPGASTLYRLGTLLARSGETAKARAAFEQALVLKPDLAEAHNDLGALLAQSGDLDAAIRQFRTALESNGEYPDALNNLGYALLLMGRDQDARALYEKALTLQPDFPEALNNLGLLAGRAGDLAEAERHFRDALARRSDYGEAANNLALILATRGQPDAAVTLLEQLLRQRPEYETGYVTLARIHLSADRPKDGIAALERLLQRNPNHAAALELLRQWKGR